MEYPGPLDFASHILHQDAHHQPQQQQQLQAGPAGQHQPHQSHHLAGQHHHHHHPALHHHPIHHLQLTPATPPPTVVVPSHHHLAQVPPSSTPSHLPQTVLGPPTPPARVVDPPEIMPEEPKAKTSLPEMWVLYQKFEVIEYNESEEVKGGPTLDEFLVEWKQRLEQVQSAGLVYPDILLVFKLLDKIDLSVNEVTEILQSLDRERKRVHNSQHPGDNTSGHGQHRSGRQGVRSSHVSLAFDLLGRLFRGRDTVKLKEAPALTKKKKRMEKVVYVNKIEGKEVISSEPFMTDSLEEDADEDALLGPADGQTDADCSGQDSGLKMEPFGEDGASRTSGAKRTSSHTDDQSGTASGEMGFVVFKEDNEDLPAEDEVRRTVNNRLEDSQSDEDMKEDAMTTNFSDNCDVDEAVKVEIKPALDMDEFEGDDDHLRDDEMYDNEGHEDGGEHQPVEDDLEVEEEKVEEEVAKPRRRGRPPGSKNKTNGQTKQSLRQERLECKVCEHKSTSLREAAEHAKSHNRVKIFRYPCPKCNFVANKSNVLKVHLAVHDLVKFSCDKCNHKSTTYWGLKRHVNKVHDMIRFKCNYCEKTFSQASNRRTHEATVHEGRRFLCDLCGYAAMKRNKLTEHTAKKHEGKRIYCDQCDYSSPDQGRFRIHVKTKHEGVTYPCKEAGCDYVCKYPKSLQQHMDCVHRGKRYPCDLCDFKAKRSDKLKMHKEKAHNIKMTTAGSDLEKANFSKTVSGEDTPSLDNTQKRLF